MCKLLIFTPVMTSMRALLFLCLLLSFFSCKKKNEPAYPPGTDTTQTYFSVKQFVKDQIITNYGQPISLYRIVTQKDKVDSSIVNFYNMEWAPIYKAFLGADIGEVKYLGRYKFSEFEESGTANRVLMYEAKEKELFTRQMQITFDPTNMRILSLYIETAKPDLRQRLLYVPSKIIQIQEDEDRMMGKTRNLRIEYRFL